jgi:hypothetical protein
MSLLSPSEFWGLGVFGWVIFRKIGLSEDAKRAE